MNKEKSSSPRVILIVNSHLKRRGNFGLRAAKICKELDKKNIQFYCLSRGGGNDKANYKDLLIFGIFARALNYLRFKFVKNLNNRLIERLLFEWLVLKVLKKIDLFHTVVHLWEYSERLIRYIHNKGGKVVLEIPSVTQNYVEDLLKENKNLKLTFSKSQLCAETNCLRLADFIITPSNFVLHYCNLVASHKRYAVVPFGFPQIKSPIKNKNLNKPLRLLFVGNVDVRKGILVIIEALSQLHNIELNVRVLGRKGSVKKKLLYSDKRIDYLDFDDPEQHYLWADLFIFPSWCEGSAKVVYEAMSYSLPVITTNASGSLVNHKQNGMIIDEGDASALAGFIRFFNSNRDNISKYGQKAYKTSLSRTWDHYTTDVINIYREQF